MGRMAASTLLRSGDPNEGLSSCLKALDDRLDTPTDRAERRRPQDWVAIFLKNNQTGRVVQRVGTLAWAASELVHAWLCALNTRRFKPTFGVNVVREGEQSRTLHAMGAVPRTPERTTRTCSRPTASSAA
jgi:hypothetical protein